jgi:hypothetical protein
MRSCLRGEEGSEIVEFAFTSLIFLSLVFGFIGLCFTLFEYNTAAEAARDAVRWAAVRGSQCVSTVLSTDTACPVTTVAQVQTHVNTLAGGTLLTVPANGLQWCAPKGITAATPCPATTTPNSNQPGNIVQVTVQFSIVPWAAFGYASSFSGLTLSSTAQHVIWN